MKKFVNTLKAHRSGIIPTLLVLERTTGFLKVLIRKYNLPNGEQEGSLLNPILLIYGILCQRKTEILLPIQFVI